MDGVSAAVSLINLVEISARVLSLTVEYSTKVKNAKEDIARFRLELEALIKVLRSLQELVQTEATPLVTFKSLAESIQQCELDLEHLQKKLEPGKGRKAMSRYGVRALKWPFESRELHSLIGNLERYKSTFSTALSADQISLILEAGVKLDLAEQDRCLSKLSYAVGANFDSKERENEPYCLPDTRVEILSQIMEWSAASHHKRIFWLNGMAGTGKSTIARTIARTLTEQKRLAANFFFSRARGDLSHADKFLSTIAIQLAASSRTLKRYICEAIAEGDNVSRQSMRDQWTKLIYQPISRLRGDLQPPLILVFVFDAIDECGRQEDIRKLLQLIAEAKDLAAVQFRILFTSRPEIPIRFGFRAIPGNMHEDFVLHNIASPVIQHDIAIFLSHELRKIRDEYLLPSDWPSKNSLELLVERSSGLFIYAATVCRFIHNPRWLPIRRLEIVLQGNGDEQSPEQRLDEMYIQILNVSVFDDCNENERNLLSRQFRTIVGSIIVLFDSLSTTALKLLFPKLSETIDITLDPLKSLLEVPDDGNTPIRLLHPSFRDFLVNQERCRAEFFWIDQEKAHYDVADQCLSLMSKTLRKNICRLETLGLVKFDTDQTVLNQHLPIQLQYACQYWVYHLQKGRLSVGEVERVYVFLRTHFLHWLEVLSLMRKTSDAVLLITRLEHIPEFQTNENLLAFVKDAKRFILEFRYIVGAAPLQIYNSALVFSPQASVIKRVFSNQMPGWIERLPKVDENWTSSLQVLVGHESWANVVVFSPDGQLLASGSSDNIIRLWDPLTGDLRGMLKGHSSRVYAAVFSPDGQLLASSSDDGTIKLWNPIIGDSQGTFTGHSIRIRALVFSPDGQLLASGSDDKTVKLWDPITGDSRGTLKSHLGWVNAVVFSPDGQLLASSSDDKTVKIWNPITGDLQGTFTGHSSPVHVVVFSPNGQLLASGSHDRTVKLWDPTTGDLRGTLTGHSSKVRAVVFSPNGQLLASGSDRTIRLWDSITGDLRSTFEGHLSWVEALVFSPNGQLLASGSHDKTVRLWDLVTGISRGTLEGHSDRVKAVVFSPDGHLLVSGSYDTAVRLWDPITGDSRGTLDGHSSWFNALAFSPDGKLLASACGDHTIRLWDPVTGDSRKPLEGHSNWVRALGFSTDGQLLASGSDDSTVRLWDPLTGDSRGTLEGHSSWIRTVAFSPDGQLLASGSNDNTVRLWNPVTRDSRGTLKGHLNLVRAVAFSPDGQLLASGSDDGYVRLWRIEQTFCIQLIDIEHLSQGNIYFSGDGSQLILDGRPVEINSRFLTAAPEKQAPADTFYSMSVDNAWVSWKNFDILWLPFNRRPGVHTTKDNKLAIGSGSGRMTFFSFSPTLTPF